MINNEKGMTLNEILVVIAILGIVGMMGFQFYLSSVGVFERQQMIGEQTIIMQHVRDVITAEIRFVEAAKLTDSIESLDDGYYLSLTSQSNNLMKTEILVDNNNVVEQNYRYENEMGNEVIENPELLDDTIIGVHTIKVAFLKGADADDVLNIIVTLDAGTDYGAIYEFSVRLMNMRLGGNVIDDSVSSGISVYSIIGDDDDDDEEEVEEVGFERLLFKFNVD